jgi:hypothetical protein
MALGAQMVDLVRFDVVNQIIQLLSARKIAVMEKQPHSCVVWILVDVIETASVKAAGATNYSMDFIVPRQEPLRQVRSILACDTRD